MAQVQQKRNGNTSPWKFVLAAVLAVVLIVVLVVQFGGTSSAEGTGTENRQAEQQAKPPHREDASAGTQDGSGTRPTASRWPVLRRAEVLKYDPFAFLRAFRKQQDAAIAGVVEKSQEEAASAEAEAAQRQAEMGQALDGLRQQGVAVVIGSGERSVAVVGSQTVRVGDLLDGFRVVAIAPDGVTVERPAGGEE